MYVKKRLLVPLSSRLITNDRLDALVHFPDNGSKSGIPSEGRNLLEAGCQRKSELRMGSRGSIFQAHHRIDATIPMNCARSTSPHIMTVKKRKSKKTCQLSTFLYFNPNLSILWCIENHFKYPEGFVSFV